MIKQIIEWKSPIEQSKPIGLLNRNYHDNDATAATLLPHYAVLDVIKRER